MLTKDLINARSRSGKLIPTFLKGESFKKVEALANSLQDLFESSEGMQINQLEESVGDMISSSSKVESGLVKLLMDRIKEDETDPEVSDKRFDMILKAQSLRRVMFSEEIQEHRSELESTYGKTFKELSFDLYADLPEYRRVKSFKPVLDRDLINRYNVAQVQAHLVHCRSLKIFVKASSVSEIRLFIQKMKFSRLYAEIKKEGSSGYSMKLSGPLDVFQNSQAYGLRLANFFPYILNFDTWSVEADVKYKNKSLEMSLDQKSKLQPIYKQSKSYIPEEFADFLSSINESSAGFKVHPSEAFIDLGHQNYSFPDFDLISQTKTIHLEFFHRWHWAELNSKLEAFSKNPRNDLVFLIERGIANKEQVKDLKNKFSSINMVEYNGFPTPKALEKLLKTC